MLLACVFSMPGLHRARAWAARGRLFFKHSGGRARAQEKHADRPQGYGKNAVQKSRTRRKRRRPGTAHAEEQASAARRPAAGRWRRLMRLPSWFPAVNGVQAGTFPCACHGTSSEKTPRPARAGSSRAKPCRPAPRRRMASGFPRQRRRKRTFPPPPLPGKRAPAPERQRRKKRVPPRRPAGTERLPEGTFRQAERSDTDGKTTPRAQAKKPPCARRRKTFFVMPMMLHAAPQTMRQKTRTGRPDLKPGPSCRPQALSSGLLNRYGAHVHTKVH